ncbi:MAG: glutamate-1-semialdehyde 2,1-aminomutase [Verrucomicrobia bacterium]|nr:glutamate-1-semialdehyde 2,1-aminomutase [Verrucomicrobiota bacterium]
MNCRESSWWDRARRVIPGGVNSPVRAFGRVGGTPFFIASGSGATITDVTGRTSIDYLASWGPLILGHAHPRVVEAIQCACAEGTSFGSPTVCEVEFAEMLVDAVPSIEQVRLVSSGTEAAMSAIRLARGFTGRDDIVKFDGCYHGHSDCLLVKAGSGGATFDVPDSAGVPADFAKHTITLPFNDAAAVEHTLDEHGGRIACIILEPVCGNVGVIPPRAGFLEACRAACRKHGALLIFDEVITGFRVAYGGAQQMYRVTPDLTCLGKVIGGGLPIGAFGGRADIMQRLAPTGTVYQAGTLSGNPLAVTAGIETLRLLQEPGTYERLEALGARLGDGFTRIFRRHGIVVQCPRVGSMLSCFFTSKAVADARTAMTTDAALYAKWFHGLLDRGISVAPSPYEAMFVSLAHTEALIDRTLAAADDVAQELAPW